MTGGLGFWPAWDDSLSGKPPRWRSLDDQVMSSFSESAYAMVVNRLEGESGCSLKYSKTLDMSKVQVIL